MIFQKIIPKTRFKMKYAYYKENRETLLSHIEVYYVNEN